MKKILTILGEAIDIVNRYYKDKFKIQSGFTFEYIIEKSITDKDEFWLCCEKSIHPEGIPTWEIGRFIEDLENILKKLLPIIDIPCIIKIQPVEKLRWNAEKRYNEIIGIHHELIFTIEAR